MTGQYPLPYCLVALLPCCPGCHIALLPCCPRCPVAFCRLCCLVALVALLPWSPCCPAALLPLLPSCLVALFPWLPWLPCCPGCLVALVALLPCCPAALLPLLPCCPVWPCYPVALLLWLPFCFAAYIALVALLPRCPLALAFVSNPLALAFYGFWMANSWGKKCMHWLMHGSKAWVARKKERQEKGAGKGSERSLVSSLTTRNREVATSPWHFLVVLHVGSSLRQEFQRKIQAVYILKNVH